MASIQYRLSSRVSMGMSEVLVRFYDNDRCAQRAKSRVYTPVVLWDSKEGLPALSKKCTKESVAACAARMKLEQIRSAVFARYLAEKDYADDGWLQRVIDDVMINKLRRKEA